jgi:hypothetical protein
LTQTRDRLTTSFIVQNKIIDASSHYQEIKQNGIKKGIQEGTTKRQGLGNSLQRGRCPKKEY